MTMTFARLRQKHGDIEAMRILEMIEEFVSLRERYMILLSNLEDRFTVAVERFERVEKGRR